MISELTLVGFKSFVKQVIDFRALTVLTGLNSSGKSSVIQALLMASKIFNQSDSLMLDGHGSLEDIKNPFTKENMLIGVARDNEELYQVDIDLSRTTGRKFSSSFTPNFVFPEIIYVSANRFGPRSSVPIYNDSFKRQRLGPNGENLFQFIQAHESEILDDRLVHPHSEGKTLEYNIRGWLDVISPNSRFKFVIDPKSDTSYALFNEHRAANVGFGLSYSLSVIAALLVGSLTPGCMVIIENPEAHLHPKGQVGMAKLIAACAEVGNNQMIIETHSDHVFDALRIAAKDSEGLHEKIQVHWFELDEHRNSVIESPNMDSDGRLDRWPEGLFDQFEINAGKLI